MSTTRTPFRPPVSSRNPDAEHVILHFTSQIQKKNDSEKSISAHELEA
jgi:hypothetical protein